MRGGMECALALANGLMGGCSEAKHLLIINNLGYSVTSKEIRFFKERFVGYVSATAQKMLNLLSNGLRARYETLYGQESWTKFGCRRACALTEHP